MIFVSYCQQDRAACDQLLKMAAPLTKYGGIRLWTDSDIQPGSTWKKSIEKALDETSVAVLLVTDGFLASAFIQTVELPYFLEATKKRGIEFMWVLVSDCLWKHTPLSELQAAHPVKEPLDHLSPAKQKTAWRMVVEKIDDAWRRYQRPKINTALNGHKVFREEPNFHVLAAPARRRTEVFVYGEEAKQWWHVGAIPAGKTHCKVYFGGENTRDGAVFRMMGVTTSQPVQGMMTPPSDGTHSEQVTLYRKNR
jgi:hypothetical protein